MLLPIPIIAQSGEGVGSWLVGAPGCGTMPGARTSGDMGMPHTIPRGRPPRVADAGADAHAAVAAATDAADGSAMLLGAAVAAATGGAAEVLGEGTSNAVGPQRAPATVVAAAADGAGGGLLADSDSRCWAWALLLLAGVPGAEPP